MASFEPIIRMDENAFRAREKIQPKAGRRPLTDMTNSKKPLGKDRSSVKNLSGFKASEKVVQPKAGRKPLGDLTNSKQPRVHEKSSNASAAKKEQLHSCSAFKEGFLHNHDECIKANRQSLTMSMDYFLETVALKRDASMPTLAPPQPPKPSKLELDTLMMIEEMELIKPLNFSAPPSPPSPKSPSWSSDFENLEFSPLRLKDSPVKGYFRDCSFCP